MASPGPVDPAEPVVVRCDAVLFDSDGVLVDSERSVERSWSTLAAEFELDVERLFAELAGVRAVDTLARHLDGPRLGAAVRRLEELEVTTSDDVVAVPGAVELLASLPPERWAIATSATRRLAEVRWSAAGIQPRGPTVTADDVERGKPHPDPFVRGADLVGVHPRRCVVFEDSPSGGLAAERAGSRVIAVGATPWEVVPVARVTDLRSVDLVAATADGLVLRIGPVPASSPGAG